ncbi:MAG: LytR/AlgR family response regulator transcription factor [Arcticibacter sp.]
MQIFKCVIVDDELPSLAYLRALCDDVPFIQVIKAYNDPVKFLKEAESMDFQICILDIEMPGMKGIELAAGLSNKAIIFATAYKEYAAEAFELEAVDYLTKPIRKERLEKALSRAKNLLGHQETTDQFVVLNSNRGKILLRFPEIAIITTSEIDHRDKKVLLKNHEEVILKNISFQQLLNSLPDGQFLQINRKTAISMNCVVSFTHDSVRTTLNDERGQSVILPLTDQFRSSFREHAGK